MKMRLAEALDDSQLRRLARETVVPGHIRMIYAREPCFFDSVRSVGGSTQVAVADDKGRIVGQACRSITDLYVNGTSMPVGYLSGLKLGASIQGGTVLARGYAYVKKLHGDNRTDAYLTTIVQGNDRAIKLLTSGRAGLPSYVSMGAYLTYVVPVRKRPHKPRVSWGGDIVPGVEVSKDDLVEFLAQEGPRRQFFPDCRPNGDTGRLLDAIGMQNVFVARSNNQIVGMMAVWNQERYKQCIVDGYSLLFRLLRPCLNIGLKLRGYHSLPSSGERLRYATAALVCVRHDDTHVFKSLLYHALDRSADDGLHHLAVGLHENDPLRSCMRSICHVIYRSSLYLVSWGDTSFHASLDQTRIPYLELGVL